MDNGAQAYPQQMLRLVGSTAHIEKKGVSTLASLGDARSRAGLPPTSAR